MSDFFHGVFRDFGRKRFRTALTILGIAIGVASVVIISDISQCGANAVTGEMDSLGMSGLMITKSIDDTSISLAEQDLKQISGMTQVELATPVLTANTQIMTRDGNTNAILWGVDSNAANIVSLTTVYGRLFSRKDVNTSANVCLVDEELSQKLYSRKNIIGKKIELSYGGSGQEYTVVGIIKTGSGLLQNLIGDYIPTFIYVPYTTVQKVNSRTDFDQIIVKLKPDTNSENTGNLILKRLNASKGTTKAFFSNDLAKQKNGLLNIMNIVTLMLSAVGAVSLLVASLSIMTVMTVSVTERTREIGIKKALGATNAAIMAEFLWEAVLLSVIGSAAGIAVGCGISWLLSLYLHTQFAVRPDIMAIASLFAILSGVIFSVSPALQASRLRPVDALRQD